MVFLRKPLFQDNSTRVIVTPPAKPLPKQHDTGVDDDILEDLVDAFEHLYDPDQRNHLVIDEQLKYYKARDLSKTKLYKTALQYFGHYRTVLENTGENQNRKRVIVATLHSPSLWQTSAPHPIMDGSSKKSTFPKMEVQNDKLDAEEDFASWIDNRRKLRNNLNNFGNVEHYLRNKGDLSSYEKRIQQNITQLKNKKSFEEEKKPVVENVLLHATRKDVKVNQPSPLALAVIDYELKKRKIRLLDLFATVDKDKNWFLSREEFKHAFKIAKIPLPISLLEDLVITLDNDNNNRLDYREINAGLQIYRREKRLGLVNYANTVKKLQEEFNAQDDVIDDDQKSQKSSSRLSISATINDKEDRENSKLSTTSIESNHSDPPSLLSPPPNDVRPEQFVNENPEIALDLRVRDRAALHRFNDARQLAASERWRGEKYVRKLKEDAAGADNVEKRNVIRTGNVAYDAHCTPSSLSNGNQLAQKIDAYRQNQFREYMELMRLCQSRGIVLNQKLFEKVLLHPGDQPREEIKHNVRQPGAQLRLSSHFYKRAAMTTSSTTAASIGNATVDSSAMESVRVDSRRRRKRAVNLACAETSLPMKRELVVDDEDAEKELSTGTAYVRRKVDCWLTFEEFQRLTEHVDNARHRRLTVASNSAFWPGQLTDRLRRHVDTCAYSSNVFFQNLAPSVGSRRANHGYIARQFYPLSEHGHVTYANIDPKLHYEITHAH